MTASDKCQQKPGAFRTVQGRWAGVVCCAWLVAGLVALAALPQETTSDEQYLRIYGLITQADTLSQNGQIEAAKAKYQEAYAALRAFRERYPNWSSKVVAHRLKDVATKLAALDRPAPPPAAEPGQTNLATPTPAPAKPTALPPGVQFKLLTAGAEPRMTLRFHPKPGDTQTVTMTLSLALDIHGESFTNQVKLPPLKLTLNSSIVGVAPGGDFTYKTIVTDVDIGGANGSPEMADALKQAAGILRGMSYRGTLSDRGFPKAFETRTPSTVEPQFQQALDQVRQAVGVLGMQWPEEAVGPGARWQTTQPVKSQGMTFQQTTQGELTAVEGDRVTVNYAVSQQAGSQRIQLAGLQGMSAELLGMTGRGNGKATFDLTRVMPTNAKMESQSETSLRMNIGGQPQTMTIKTSMDFDVVEP